MEKASIDSFSDSSEFMSEREHQRVTADYKYRSGKSVSSIDGVSIIEEPMMSDSHSGLG
jgi:hypothetical protein